MSSLIFSLPEFYTAYKRWVSQNPLKASDYEMTTKWISYFLAGRINNSHILSELVYCLSNLLVLFNDRLISDAQKLEIPSSGDQLKLWLTVLEYCEVFLELSVKKLWGTSAKWILVVSVQLFKCIGRLMLVYHHKENIIQQPPIPPLYRRDMKKAEQENGVAELAQAQLDSISFNLKRSGKTIRKIDASPPVGSRNWKPIERALFDNEQTIEQSLAGQQLIAESIYILKPMVHLASMACFGTQTWKPWAISLILDASSLHLYNKGNKKQDSLTKKQKMQLSRRYVGLLMYLLRSPFYEKQSKKRIEALLNALSKSVPFASMICLPLNKYLPFWQSNYFYLWSN
ncbi:PREDICTED: peroxisomal membrane protein PEX16 [Nicrophorus vespilloides]|uniref:Peroxisomal membrane protein PEX16 n=1 Tax=Nicrophorus vespilloides TaxID=110193 RepID=A0ABM1MVH3_NICVS|nr:PREDICTED: peroxisomal membrane protein PEX16 [Nicrophorus vespilloides]